MPRPDDLRQQLALWVWYRGGAFRGFQAQPGGGSLQQAFEHALLRHKVTARVWPAGRTDRGVHARMQVLSVRAQAGVEPSALEEIGHGQDLGVVRAVVAPAGFHAQFSAVGKEYRYRLARGPVEPAWSPYCWDVSAEPRLEGARIDVGLLEACLASYVGERDFIAFHEKSSPRRTRALHAAVLREEHGRLDLRLRGASFGRYMARYLVGSAVLVAAGRLDRAALRDAVEGGLEIPGLKAPGHGLVLWEVDYPAPLDPFAKDRRVPELAPRGPPFED